MPGVRPVRGTSLQLQGGLFTEDLSIRFQMSDCRLCLQAFVFITNTQRV